MDKIPTLAETLWPVPSPCIRQSSSAVPRLKRKCLCRSLWRAMETAVAQNGRGYKHKWNGQRRLTGIMILTLPGFGLILRQDNSRSLMVKPGSMRMDEHRGPVMAGGADGIAWAI